MKRHTVISEKAAALKQVAMGPFPHPLRVRSDVQKGQMWGEGKTRMWYPKYSPSGERYKSERGS